MGDGGASREAARARRAEEERQHNIKVGTQRVRDTFATQFNQPYYDSLRGDVTKVFAGDAATQYKQAQRALQTALMRSGLWSSSVRASKEGLLEENRVRAGDEVARRASGIEQERKQDVEFAQNSVINQLNQNADAQSAMATAASQIEANRATPAVPMLGQVFQDITAGLATQADLERQGGAKYNVFGRIPGWGSNSRYTRNVGG